MKKEMSIIIPFRNEGEEIYKTIRSINQVTPETTLEIICVDDKSDDGFNYKKSIKAFKNVRYYKNSSQLGVAGSRDKGVQLAETPYILLLDGHMRFLKDNITPLIEKLKNNPRTLYCLQSRILKEEGGKIFMNEKLPTSSAARINFDTSNLFSFLHAEWDFLKMTDYLEEEIEVPCVLGAAYAINKAYYLYLHGLNGLSMYGLDEAFLSTKVWMEGGKCILLRNMEAGHIYRKTSPCGVNSSSIYYNKVIYSELFLPEDLKEIFYQHLRQLGLYDIIMPFINEIREELAFEKKYLDFIFKRDFKEIINLNRHKNDRIYPQ